MSAHSPLRPTAPDTEVTELLDLALDLICVAGLDGYFKRVNKAWTDVLGYPKTELLTQPWINPRPSRRPGGDDCGGRQGFSRI